MNVPMAMPAVRVPVQVDSVQPATGAGEKSWGKTFPKARFDGIDAEAFRAWFAPALATWLRERYQSPHVVAAVFSCDIRTAENWWAGRNTASGHVVGLVFLSVPGAVAWFMAEWARGDR